MAWNAFPIYHSSQMFALKMFTSSANIGNELIIPKLWFAPRKQKWFRQDTFYTANISVKSFENTDFIPSAQANTKVFLFFFFLGNQQAQLQVAQPNQCLTLKVLFKFQSLIQWSNKSTSYLIWQSLLSTVIKCISLWHIMENIALTMWSDKNNNGIFFSRGTLITYGQCSRTN